MYIFKLKKWVKISITLFIILTIPFIIRTLKILGEFILSSEVAEVCCILGWFWLIIGQVLFLIMIWEN